jgi:aminotransferase
MCKKEKNVKVLILNYPANPTGTSYTRDELVQIAKVVKKHDLVVISDEIYDRLSYSFKHTPFPTIPKMKERTVYLNGFSKTYAMTGWRIGFSCGPKKVIAAMTKIHQYNMLCAPIMSQMAAIEALRHSKVSIEYMIKEYIRRKRFLLNKFNELGLKCNDPQGTFYLYPNIGKFYNNSVNFAKDLVEKQKVAVVPGLAFDPKGNKHIRVSYASNLKQLKEASNRIENFLSSISR